MARKNAVKMLLATITLIMAVGASWALSPWQQFGGISGPLDLNTPKCQSVAISTVAPTQLYAQDRTRGAMWIVNASTSPFFAGSRPAIVYITTGATTNLGSNPAPSSIPLLAGIPIYPCGNTSSPLSPGCMWPPSQTNSIWQNAIYAIAESSASATNPASAIVQSCVLDP